MRGTIIDISYLETTTLGYILLLLLLLMRCIFYNQNILYFKAVTFDYSEGEVLVQIFCKTHVSLKWC